MAVEELSYVADAAVSEFERFGGGVKAALSFVEGREGKPHGLLDGSGVWRKHDGVQPIGRNPFPGRLIYLQLRVPKRSNGTINKIQMLSKPLSKTGYSAPMLLST
jgi:hypothetical protein